jgi:thioredoxin-related protein
MQTLKLVILLGCLTVFTFGHKPIETVEKTKWMTLREASDSLKKEKRPILVDLYTDWCGWCKVMDKKTYSHKQVSEYLGQKFYAVKIDAESKQAIEWNGKSYPFNAQYRTNEFALYLTQGQLSYPTTVIIPVDGTAPQAIPGYLEPKDFEMIVKYFGEGHYGKTPFPQYQRSFKSSWK